MSNIHAQARTIAEADPAALAWVRDDQGGQTPEVFSLDTVLRAFGAGQIKGASQYGGPLWAVTAVRLLRDATATFRAYEDSHRAKARDLTATTEEREERHNKADRNRAMARGITDFLAGEDIPRDTVIELASDLVRSLDDLIGSSEGVAGLHRNGDLAPWDTLLEGGEFEAWLKALDAMRAGLDAAGMAETRLTPEPAKTKPLAVKTRPPLWLCVSPSTMMVRADANGIPYDLDGRITLTVQGEGFDQVEWTIGGTTYTTGRRLHVPIRCLTEVDQLPVTVAVATSLPSNDAALRVSDTVTLTKTRESVRRNCACGGINIDENRIDDPVAFVRTIETAVAADLIPGVTADDLSLMRIGARLGMTAKDTPLDVARKGLDAWASVPVYGQVERDEAIRVLMQSFDGCSTATSREHQIARGAVIDLIATTLGLTYRDVRTDQDRI
jgi:hypothetical protein